MRLRNIFQPVLKPVLRSVLGNDDAPPTATSTPLTVYLETGTRQITFTNQSGGIDIRWGASAPTTTNRIRVVTGGSLIIGVPTGTTQMTVQAVAADVVLRYTESATQYDYIKPMAIYGMAVSDEDFVYAKNVPIDDLTDHQMVIHQLAYGEETSSQSEWIALMAPLGVDPEPVNSNNYIGLQRKANDDYRIDMKSTTVHSDNWVTTLTYPALDSVALFIDSTTDRAIHSNLLSATETFTAASTGDFPAGCDAFYLLRQPYSPSGAPDYSDMGYVVYAGSFNEDRGSMGTTPVDNAMTQYPGKAFSGMDCFVCVAWDEDLGLLDLTGRGSTVAEVGTVTTAVQSGLSELSSMVNPNTVESDQHVAVSYDGTGTLTTLPTHEGLFYFYAPDAIDTSLEWYDGSDVLIPTNGTLTLGAGTIIRVFAPFHAVKVKLKSTSTGTADLCAITS